MTPYNSEHFRLIPDGLVYNETFNELPARTQLLFYKLIGCPEMNMLGIFKLRPLRAASIEFDMSEADLLEALNQLQEAEFILFSEQTREVAITYWLAWGITGGGTPVTDGIASGYRQLENKELACTVWDKMRAKNFEIKGGIRKAIKEALPGIDTF